MSFQQAEYSTIPAELNLLGFEGLIRDSFGLFREIYNTALFGSRCVSNFYATLHGRDLMSPFNQDDLPSIHQTFYGGAAMAFQKQFALEAMQAINKKAFSILSYYGNDDIKALPPEERRIVRICSFLHTYFCYKKVFEEIVAYRMHTGQRLISDHNPYEIDPLHEPPTLEVMRQDVMNLKRAFLPSNVRKITPDSNYVRYHNARLFATLIYDRISNATSALSGLITLLEVESPKYLERHIGLLKDQVKLFHAIESEFASRGCQVPDCFKDCKESIL